MRKREEERWWWRRSSTASKKESHADHPRLEDLGVEPQRTLAQRRRGTKERKGEEGRRGGYGQRKGKEGKKKRETKIKGTEQEKQGKETRKEEKGIYKFTFVSTSFRKTRITAILIDLVNSPSQILDRRGRILLHPQLFYTSCIDFCDPRMYPLIFAAQVYSIPLRDSINLQRFYFRESKLVALPHEEIGRAHV